MKSEGEIRVQALTKEYLKIAVKLVEATFTDEEESGRKEVEASVDEKKFQRYVMKIDRHIRSLEYFIAINNKGKGVGIIGLYTLIENYEDTIWIGWYCVHKKQRGKGIGRMLLDFVIDKAKERGKKYICLYTSTDKNEEKAQELYERYGFYITKREKKDGYDVLYRRKSL